MSATSVGVTLSGDCLWGEGLVRLGCGAGVFAVAAPWVHYCPLARTALQHH